MEDSSGRTPVWTKDGPAVTGARETEAVVQMTVHPQFLARLCLRMGRGAASGGGTGFGSAEIGEDVSVAVDQENVGVVGRREGERGVGQIQTLVRAIAMALSSPQKPQGKQTKKEGERKATEVAIETVRSYSGRGKQ